MISAGLPTIVAGPLPSEVDWRTGSHVVIADTVRSISPGLDAIERGRADQWISVWRVSADLNFEDSYPCSRKELLSKHQGEPCWYYVRFISEVAGVKKEEYVRCKAVASADGSSDSREKSDLLRMLDTQTGVAIQEGARADAARELADDLHGQCLAKDRQIAERDIQILRLRSDLDAAIENQAPVLSDDAATQLFGKFNDLIKLWAITPTDKGLAASIMKAMLGFMTSIQDDVPLVRALMTRHRPAMQALVNAFNVSSVAIGVNAKLTVPKYHALPAKPTKKKKA